MVAVGRGAGRASEQPDRDGLATIFPSRFLRGELLRLGIPKSLWIAKVWV